MFGFKKSKSRSGKRPRTPNRQEGGRQRLETITQKKGRKAVSDLDELDSPEVSGISKGSE